MDEEKFIDPRYLEELRKYSASGRKDNDDAMALAGERYRKEFEMEPVLDGPLPSFCKLHNCTERGAWCAKCAYTAMGTMEK